MPQFRWILNGDERVPVLKVTPTGCVNNITLLDGHFAIGPTDFMVSCPGVSCFDFKILMNDNPTAQRLECTFKAAGVLVPGMGLAVKVLVANQVMTTLNEFVKSATV